MKKTILFIGIMLFLSASASATITNFNVPTTIPLNTTLTATADVDTNGTCSFQTFDYGGNPIWKLSDEPVTNGTVGTSYHVITEPRYLRDSNYTLRITCGVNSDSAVFVVGQKEILLAHTANQELDFLGSKGNQEPAFAMLAFGGLLIIGVGILFWGWNQGK